MVRFTTPSKASCAVALVSNPRVPKGYMLRLSGYLRIRNGLDCVRCKEVELLPYLYNDRDYFQKFREMFKEDYFSDGLYRDFYATLEHLSGYDNWTQTEFLHKAKEELVSEAFADLEDFTVALDTVDYSKDYVEKSVRKFCEERALENAITECSIILESKEEKNKMSDIINDALAPVFIRIPFC